MSKSVWVIYMLICPRNKADYCAYYTAERPIFQSESSCASYMKRLQPMPMVTADGYIVANLECWHIPFVLPWGNAK